MDISILFIRSCKVLGKTKEIAGSVKDLHKRHGLAKEAPPPYLKQKLKIKIAILIDDARKMTCFFFGLWGRGWSVPCRLLALKRHLVQMT